MENKENLNSNPELENNSENIVNDLNQNISLNNTNENISSENTENNQKNAADLILKRLSARKNKSENSEEIKTENEVINLTELKTEVSEIIDETDDEIDEISGEDIEELEKELPNYNQFTKEQLVEALKTELEKPLSKIRLSVDSIKINFYKKHKAEIAEKRKKFLEENKTEDGSEPEFVVEADALENEFKELYKKYKDLRAEEAQKIEEKKHQNIEAKYKIIDEIENLINNKDSLSNTFEDFKNLQKQWKEIGLVPQNEVKKLWDKYNYTVERFYDFVKINKELRDLDFKKNLEAKIQICEQAEELLLETRIVKAFRELQKLHDQWRDVGPIANDKKEETWERFKNVTNQINKKHQDYFDGLKNEQENNLKAKTLICERAEELANENVTNHKQWDDNSKEIIELQQIWRLIGFAPKKFNNQIYQRFREACDLFFERKRDFYNQSREEQENNLQLKTDLCVQVESLKDSNEWKKTTDMIINLQKKWKEIGQVPKKNSDEIWKRFRAACNEFFENKEKFFSNRHSDEENNLKLKTELIEKINSFESTDNEHENLKQLKDFQLEWSQIGFVPFKNKEEIQTKYREAIDKKFSQLKLDDYKRDEMRLKNTIDDYKRQPKAKDKISTEKEKLKNKLDKIQSEIILFENNLGFFAKSKNADAMINEFKKKIEDSKNQVKSLQKQINLLENEQESLD